jgi:hypothetical protein
MEAVVTIERVQTFETSRGSTRYVVRDTDGNEYTTFREPIGERAQELEGARVRIDYHEAQRGRYTWRRPRGSSANRSPRRRSRRMSSTKS